MELQVRLLVSKFAVCWSLLAAMLLVHVAEATPPNDPAMANNFPYIKKISADGSFNIVLLGDSLADGLYEGLTRLNKDRNRLKTKKKSKVNTGLVRADRFNWNKTAKSIAKSGKYQAAAVLLGLNDLQTIREKGKAHHFKTDGWMERYVARVETMMRDLKAGGLAVYWISIPIVTPDHYQEDFVFLNEIYRKAAKKYDVRFIDTWTPLAGKDGSYSPFYVDHDGKKQEIRRRDGVHFTSDGYLVFAKIINEVLMTDLQSVSPELIDEKLN